ncbi:MAG: hypothetical protein ACFFDN_21175, partial [Candidatus Hodarchaeota archaeon]
SDVIEKVKLALPFSPDLFIVYTGHNVFLHLMDPYAKKDSRHSIPVNEEYNIFENLLKGDGFSS